MLPDHQAIELKLVLDSQAIDRLMDLMTQALKRSAGVESPDNRRLVASRQALFAGQKPSEDRGLLIDTREVSKLLKVCPKTVYQMQKDGKMPAQVCIGKSVRWGYEELRAWVNAGCPPRAEWKWPLSDK